MIPTRSDQQKHNLAKRSGGSSPITCRELVGRKAIALTLSVLCGLSGSIAEEAPQATILWTLQLPAFNTGSSPSLAPDGTLYFGLFDGTLLAVSEQGAIRWKFKTASEIKSSPAIGDDGTIYFGSRDRKVYALKPTGELKWSFPTVAWVDSSPALATDGTIYFGSWDRSFYALHPDGTLRWKMDVRAVIDSSPAIAIDGTVYFGAHDGVLYALNPSGSVRWHFATGGPIISSPAIGRDGAVYFSSGDGNLYAVNSDGTQRWRYRSGSITASSPILNEDEQVCIGINTSTLLISPEGQYVWHLGSALATEVSQLAVSGMFYYSRAWRLVNGVKPHQLLLWGASLDDNTSASLNLSSNGILYGCIQGRLYALQPPGPILPLSESSWPMFHANPRHTGRVETPSAKR